MALPRGLTGPVQVALARAVEQIPHVGALPGGARFEPKWDGFRVVVTRDHSGAHLWSRRGTDLTSTFPEITSSASDQIESGTVLDGEVVIWSGGRLDFAALQTRMGRGSRNAAVHALRHPASYASFDVLAHAGRDIRNLPLDDRRRVLEELAAAWEPPLNLSPVTDDRSTATEWFENYALVGIEGLVIKGGAQPYPTGKRGWLKVKHRTTLDVVCGAVIGTRSSPQQVVAGLPVGEALRIVGRTGPLSPPARRALAQWLVPPAGEHPWPAQVSPTALARFNTSKGPVDLTLVDPVVVEVSADVAWDGQSFRHILRFVRARPDTEVSSVTAPDNTGAHMAQ
ncbi:ATP dependent DNA ligase domain-containing protein [Promicromonospora umidemergens]|uniref:ATP-dependent DNA ligase n=1 Tax=Promicromonospora umidemergens TaxID=629679 RepID=A0ABP8WVL6_9MICO|nr:ATP-dependent DNA ligase [Promicromonospora umidemergens]MCP2287042.1 ATP dependent DNA ligase domain-containing protein [Promicromonospora umidemergens]